MCPLVHPLGRSAVCPFVCTYTVVKCDTPVHPRVATGLFVVMETSWHWLPSRLFLRPAPVVFDAPSAVILSTLLSSVSLFPSGFLAISYILVELLHVLQTASISYNCKTSEWIFDWQIAPISCIPVERLLASISYILVEFMNFRLTNSLRFLHPCRLHEFSTELPLFYMIPWIFDK